MPIQLPIKVRKVEADMSDLQTFYKDKPYFFVPLVKTVVRTAITDHRNVMENKNGKLKYMSGKLKIELTAQTPVHFGQGELITRDGSTVYHALSREHGRAALSGSSFKGMIRALFESLTHSCVLFYPRRTDYMLVRQTSCDQLRSLESVCPACSVFGCRGLKGKLHFSSLVADSSAEAETLIAPNLQAPFRDYSKTIGNERLYYGWFENMNGPKIGNLTKQEFFKMKRSKIPDHSEFYGRKFYKHSKALESGKDKLGSTYECLKAGTVLRGELVYEGLSEAELSALLFALGLGWDKPIYHKIGYAKPAYLGSVEIHTEQVALAERYSSLQQNNADLRALAQEYRRKADPEVLAAINAIAEQWSSLNGDNQWISDEGGRRNY
jgi:hypothetical protein